MSDRVDDFVPLAPAMLHILLALAGGSLHGYAIMQEAMRQTGSRYKIGPGTLYDNLQRLMKQGLVEEITSGPEDEKSRRRYYRISSLGMAVLAAEVERLEGVIKTARIHLEPLQTRRA
jgi:DNA-binding PadR family transcriptional regulator